MPSSPVPAPEQTKSEKHESSLEGLPLVKSVKDASKFFKTRKAILNRERLHNLSIDDVKAIGYLGPWAFNTVQNVISSVPGIIVSAWLSLLMSEPIRPKFNDPIEAKIAGYLLPLQARRVKIFMRRVDRT